MVVFRDFSLGFFPATGAKHSHDFPSAPPVYKPFFKNFPTRRRFSPAKAVFSGFSTFLVGEKRISSFFGGLAEARSQVFRTVKFGPGRSEIQLDGKNPPAKLVLIHGTNQRSV